jgi:hypothetical protein
MMADHRHQRDDIPDLFRPPFWDKIPDKPFSGTNHNHTRSQITDFWNAPFWNNIPDKPSFFKPRARAYLSSPQTINNNTWTLVNIDTISFDTDSGWNKNTHKYTIPKSGYYLVISRVSWGNIQAGRYIVSVNDGSDRTIHEDQFSTVSNYIAMSFSDILYFSQGAQVGLYVYQNTGTNTPAVYAGQTRTFLVLIYVSE